MSRFSSHHEPPPAPVVAELVRAGLSWNTAMAMEQWKAREVLELLRSEVTDAHVGRLGNGARAHGTI